MPFNKKILIIIVNIFCIFTIVGCAQVKNYSPNALSKSYTLTNFSILEQIRAMMDIICAI